MGSLFYLRILYNQTHAGSSFSLFSYLRFAEAASFDKKELCRSDTTMHLSIIHCIAFNLYLSYKCMYRIG
jgi:hypothetical protein